MKGYSNLLFDHWSLFLWKKKLRKKKKDNVFVILWASLVAPRLKCLPLMQERWVRSLGWEDPLEEGMATHSILVWEIPWTEKPGGLQSTGLQSIGHG